MIRVLHCVNDMHRAGLETMLMNYDRVMPHDQIQFDFMTHRPWRSDYDNEIEALGGKIYYAPRLFPWNYPSYFRYMRKFFQTHPEYRIVHSHIDAMSFLPLLAAKRANIQVRIAHSHNISIDKDFKYPLKQCFRKLLPLVATDYCACGEEAGEFLFGKRAFTSIPNAIDPTNFLYNEAVRIKIRKSLEVDENAFVVGHVGRLTAQKNHEYLLEVFQKLSDKCDSARLLLVGTGEKLSYLLKITDSMSLTDRVLFLGNRSDVAALYQAMDVFVMPSLFEGIPVVGIEAQFADLPCVFSTRVPKEVAFSENVSFLPLSGGTDMWVQKILACRGVKRRRLSACECDIPYNIENAKKLLFDYYQMLEKQRYI